MTTNYGDPKYWESRYENVTSTFDWLEDYDTLKPIIDDFGFSKQIKILVIGCGNSEFSENLYDDGFKQIVSIDISAKVIDFMKTRKKDRTELQYEVMDARELKFEDNFFDFVVDKSTIDSLLCGEKSFLNVAAVTKEVQRVLKPGGFYTVISYGTPENRVFHFEREHLSFDITIYNIKKDYKLDEAFPVHEKVHYVYICKKKPDADSVSKEKYSKVVEELSKQDRLEEEEVADGEGEEEYDENDNLEEDINEDDVDLG